jgi:hypothetical protein
VPATTKAIAALVGPTLVALALAMLINLASMPALTAEISREPALIMISGILLFIAGLAIVRVHNQWARDWSVLVTMLGWLSLVGGLTRMLFPYQLGSAVVIVGQHTGLEVPAAIVIFLFGAFLSYKAYS